MSIEVPQFPAEFNWQILRSILEDYLYRLQQLLNSRLVGDGVQDLNGAGNVSTDGLVTRWTTTGANAGTLLDGFQGQVKIIVMIADGGDGTLTPTNLANGTTITFNDAGDTVVLQFHGSEWWVLSNNGCTIA